MAHDTDGDLMQRHMSRGQNSEVSARTEILLGSPRSPVPFGQALEDVRRAHLRIVEDLRTENAFLRERLAEREPVTPQYDVELSGNKWLQIEDEEPSTPRKSPISSLRLQGKLGMTSPRSESGASTSKAAFPSLAMPSPAPPWSPRSPRFDFPPIPPPASHQAAEWDLEDPVGGEVVAPNVGCMATGKAAQENESMHTGEALKPCMQPRLQVQEDSRLCRIVRSPKFEMLSAILSLAGGVLVALKLQYQGLDVGYTLSMEGFDKPAAEYSAWVGAPMCFDIGDATFMVLYTMELLLRVVADPKAAARSTWSLFDLITVVVLGLHTIAGRGLNPTTLRLAHVIRMFQVVFRRPTLQVARSLLFLCRSLSAGLPTLVWGFSFLMILQIAVVMCVLQPLTAYMQDGAEDEVTRQEVFRYWGTFSRSMLTMFEITFGDWVASCRLLFESVDEWYVVFYILYRCCICFAVARIIGGLFVAEVLRVIAHGDDGLQMFANNPMQKSLDT